MKKWCKLFISASILIESNRSNVVFVDACVCVCAYEWTKPTNGIYQGHEFTQLVPLRPHSCAFFWFYLFSPLPKWKIIIIISRRMAAGGWRRRLLRKYAIETWDLVFHRMVQHRHRLRTIRRSSSNYLCWVYVRRTPLYGKYTYFIIITIIELMPLKCNYGLFMYALQFGSAWQCFRYSNPYRRRQWCWRWRRWWWWWWYTTRRRIRHKRNFLSTAFHSTNRLQILIYVNSIIAVLLVLRIVSLAFANIVPFV